MTSANVSVGMQNAMTASDSGHVMLAPLSIVCRCVPLAGGANGLVHVSAARKERLEGKCRGDDSARIAMKHVRFWVPLATPHVIIAIVPTART